MFHNFPKKINVIEIYVEVLYNKILNDDDVVCLH